jgi:hypothetical protein
MCCASNTGYLLTGCSSGTTADVDTASNTAVGVDVGSDADIHIPMGDHACIAGLGCLRNGMTAAPNLVLSVFHFLVLPFGHDCSINQVLEGGESVVHQLVMQGLTKPLMNMYCLLASRVDVYYLLASELTSSSA